MSLREYLEQSADALERSVTDALVSDFEAAVAATTRALSSGRPLLTCGNGGSAADASHIAGELVGRFRRERRAMKVIALSSDPATTTAISNDLGFDEIFARQVEAYGQADGVLLCLSTSGRSANVLRALTTAREMGMVTIGFTGSDAGPMERLCDHVLRAASKDTPMIQQIHVCLYHHFCERVEALVDASREAP